VVLTSSEDQPASQPASQPAEASRGLLIGESQGWKISQQERERQQPELCNKKHQE